MSPTLAWTLVDVGSAVLAIVVTGAVAYAGSWQGLFRSVVTLFAVLTGISAGVTLAPRWAAALQDLGCPPESLLPFCYFMIMFLTPSFAVGVLVWLCREDDVRFSPRVDQIGGAVMGGLAGALLAGGLLVGWSMCELPAEIAATRPRQIDDLGVRTLRIVARLAMPRGDQRERVLRGDAVRSEADVGGEVVHATEPFDDENGNRRYDDTERFIDHDGNGRFTADQPVTDRPDGAATARDIGLLDRYWLSAWRRMLVLHPPKIASALFDPTSEEAREAGLVYQTAVQDPDPDERHRFSLEADQGDDAPLLEVDEGTGAVRFRGQVLAGELEKVQKRGRVKFTVVVEDAAGLSDRKEVEVTLRPPEQTRN